MILITGANGFIGFELCYSLAYNGHKVRAVARRFERSFSHPNIQFISIDDFMAFDDWSSLLSNVSCVIHCAALLDQSVCSEEYFFKFNVIFTKELFKLSALNNVKRFVFLSSIGVNGRSTPSGQPFSENSVPNPINLYSKYKLLAEESIINLSSEFKLDYVIIRSPSVYGPRMFGKMSLFQRLIYKLPFFIFVNIQNKRSFIGLDNLINFLSLCADFKRSRKASNQIFLLSDNQDMSSSDFIIKYLVALNKKVLIFPFPLPLFILYFIFRFCGKEHIYHSLFSNLQINSSKAKILLNWHPISSVDQQFKKVSCFLLKVND